jgi:hypothetical protein
MTKLFYAVVKDEHLDIWERDPKDIAYDLEKEGYVLRGSALTYSGAFDVLAKAYPDSNLLKRLHRPD